MICGFNHKCPQRLVLACSFTFLCLSCNIVTKTLKYQIISNNGLSGINASWRHSDFTSKQAIPSHNYTHKVGTATAFEKGQTLQKNAEVQHLTDENIVAKFTRLVKAWPSKVTNKMLSNKSKPKVKRDRNENVAVHKKSRLEPVKSEGANAELRKYSSKWHMLIHRP